MNGRIIRTNMMNVAQSRDFYRLKDLNANDLELIHKIAIENSSPHLQKLNKKWISLFEAPFRLKELLDQSGLASASSEELFDEAINNLEEDLHAQKEGKSIPYLRAILKEDLSFSKTDQGYMEFVHFLCVQYMRTNKVKRGVVDAMRSRKSLDLEKV